MDAQCKSHKAHEQALDNDKKRLDSHSGEIDRISVCLERLTVLSEKNEEWKKEADARLSELESVPARRWKQVESCLVTGALGLVAGALIAYFGL